MNNEITDRHESITLKTIDQIEINNKRSKSNCKYSIEPLTDELSVAVLKRVAA